MWQMRAGKYRCWAPVLPPVTFHALKLLRVPWDGIRAVYLGLWLWAELQSSAYRESTQIPGEGERGAGFDMRTGDSGTGTIQDRC